MRHITTFSAKSDMTLGYLGLNKILEFYRSYDIFFVSNICFRKRGFSFFNDLKSSVASWCTWCCPLGEMYRNVIQYHAPPADPDFFYKFCCLFHNKCCPAWFYAYKFHICLPISAHGLWEWFIILTLLLDSHIIMYYIE